MLEKFANGWPNIYLQRVIAFSHEDPLISQRYATAMAAKAAEDYHRYCNGRRNRRWVSWSSFPFSR
jgi:hypothetical protein